MQLRFPLLCIRSCSFPHGAIKVLDHLRQITTRTYASLINVSYNQCREQGSKAWGMYVLKERQESLGQSLSPSRNEHHSQLMQLQSVTFQVHSGSEELCYDVIMLHELKKHPPSDGPSRFSQVPSSIEENLAAARLQTF